ncbi:MAG TPA: hypothetical protein VFZ34_12535 [Blastocatellia bacterium]|nr:hypothetical protein [Blastocatellia bacterium]
MKSARYVHACLGICLLLGVLPLLLRAEAQSLSDPLNYRGGLRISPDKYRLKEKQCQQLLASLGEKTGFQELGFDADGFLMLGNRQNFIGGSATARHLLMDAIDFPSQLLLEAHMHSSKVVFANLGKSTLYVNMRTGRQVEHQPIRIDFSDFGKLMGPKDVLASFDLGMTLLHELVHGVRKLHDSVNEWEDVGDCERYVNTIRKELNLPERQQYIARSRTIHMPLGWTIKMAELQFARTDYRNGKLKTDELILSWDVNRVGVGDQESVSRTLSSTAAKKPEQKSTAAVQ